MPREFGHDFVVLPLFMLLVCLFPALAVADNSPPNIILILADDLGWADTGVTGSRYYETPNIDNLAAQGMRFTQAYAADAVCSPSRAAILTGLYPARVGITTNVSEIPINKETHEDVNRPLLPVRSLDFLSSTEVTIPQRLHALGYTSALVGKWHLGGPGSLPQDHGFDLNLGGSSWGRPPGYFDPYTSNVFEGRIGFAPRREGEYLLDRETDEAIAFVREHRGQKFFLYWSTYGVHKPLQAKPEMIAHFQRKTPAKSGLNPVHAAHLDDSCMAGQSRDSCPVYAAMIAHLDESVGRLLATLDTLDLTRNTLVIFTSDNGGDTTVTSNGALRSGKDSPYEGGLRVPLFIRWPGVIKAGGITDTIASGIDLFPTILGAANATPPEGKVLDGVSLLPLLRTRTPLQRETMFWHFPHYEFAEHPDDDTAPYAIIRSGNWKLIYYFEAKLELFDLARDPGETRNLVQAEPDRAQALKQHLKQWLSETGAARPKPNPDFSIWHYRLERLCASFFQDYIQFRVLISSIKQAVVHFWDKVESDTLSAR
jgi:arylsulfatase A